jgi:hypothetical protein
MSGVELEWEAVFRALSDLRAQWPVPAWDYDGRVRCVMSTIASAQEAAARTAMTSALPEVFTSDSLAGAPAPVRALADQHGGLRPGQLIFWGGQAGAPGAFGLWWPWGNGKSVSLRIGLHDMDAPKVRESKLREVFGLA